MNTPTELQLLKLRSAIARKEHYTACANHDLAKFGEWHANWSDGVMESDAEIDTLIADIEGGAE